MHYATAYSVFFFKFVGFIKIIVDHVYYLIRYVLSICVLDIRN